MFRRRMMSLPPEVPSGLQEFSSEERALLLKLAHLAITTTLDRGAAGSPASAVPQSRAIQRESRNRFTSRSSLVRSRPVLPHYCFRHFQTLRPAAITAAIAAITGRSQFCRASRCVGELPSDGSSVRGGAVALAADGP